MDRLLARMGSIEAIGVKHTVLINCVDQGGEYAI
jgi:hypothetical protein